MSAVDGPDNPRTIELLEKLEGRTGKLTREVRELKGALKKVLGKVNTIEEMAKEVEADVARANPVPRG